MKAMMGIFVVLVMAFALVSAGEAAGSSNSANTCSYSTCKPAIGVAAHNLSYASWDTCTYHKNAWQHCGCEKDPSACACSKYRTPAVMGSPSF